MKEEKEQQEKVQAEDQKENQEEALMRQLRQENRKLPFKKVSTLYVYIISVPRCV